MRRPTLLFTLLLTATALAGCATNDSATSEGDDFQNFDTSEERDTTGLGSGSDTGSGSGSGTTGEDGRETTSSTSERVSAGGACVSTLDASKNAAEPVWVLATTMGTIRVTFFCDKAPVTTQHFVNLTEEGYFDGIKFHRVIRDFMNQAGDPKTKDDSLQAEWGTGGPGYTIPDEFYCADGTISYAHPADCGEAGLGLEHDKRGVLSMANTGAPRSGGSQFFLTAVPTAWLDGKHAIFGEAADEESLNVILDINQVPTASGDRPQTPVVINKASIEWA